MNLAYRFDEFEYLHDERDAGMTSHRELERANEMIALLDALEACQVKADRLVLHVCSKKLHGSIEDTAHALSSELSVLTAQAQAFARYF